MKMTIITVCYNSERTIRDCIESVLSQDYEDIEYIVIDGLSNDNTVNIINEYRNKISKIISEPDNGLYDAMNKGIKYSTGDVIGILNSDDIFENLTVISDVAKYFASNSCISLLFGDVVHVDPNNTNKVVRYYCSKKFKPYKLRFGWMPPHNATFIKSEVFERVGNYSLYYKISADFELFVRMLILNKLLYSRMDKVLARQRTGGVSTNGIKNRIMQNAEIVKACKDNGVYTNLFLVLLKIPMKILEYFRRPTNNTN